MGVFLGPVRQPVLTRGAAALLLGGALRAPAVPEQPREDEADEDTEDDQRGVMHGHRDLQMVDGKPKKY